MFHFLLFTRFCNLHYLQWHQSVCTRTVSLIWFSHNNLRFMTLIGPDLTKFLWKWRSSLEDARPSNKASIYSCLVKCFVFFFFLRRITRVYATRSWCKSVGRHDCIFWGVYNLGWSTFKCILTLARFMTQICRPAKDCDSSAYRLLVSTTRCSNLIGC